MQPFWREELVAHFVISVLTGTHLHLSQVKHVRVECLAPGHNIEIISQYSLKILHQAGFETARQAVTLAKLRAIAIAPRPSLMML